MRKTLINFNYNFGMNKSKVTKSEQFFRIKNLKRDIFFLEIQNVNLINAK